MNELELGLKLYMSLFKALKKECEGKEKCTECFFCNDHECILDREPEDYDLLLIEEATKKTVEKEIAENGT